MDGEALVVGHGRFRALALVILSILWLPLDLYLLAAAYVLRQMLYFRRSSFASLAALRKGPQQPPRPQRPAVLITGLATTQGLFLARAFRRIGCRVIGADESSSRRLHIPYWRPSLRLLPPGALSTAVQRFYWLPPAGKDGRQDSRIKALRRIIEAEKAAYWIHCGSLNKAADIEATAVIAETTKCQPVAFDKPAAENLRNQDGALRWLGEELGLQVPQTHTVRSRDQVHRVLSNELLQQSEGKSAKPYLLRPIDADTENNSDDEDIQSVHRSIRLPKRSVSETYETLSRLRVNPETPYALTQELVGSRYQTVALVVRNEVRMFVANEYPAVHSLGFGLKALSADSAISVAMLKYNQSFASRCSQHLSGHVTFDFAVEERATEAGITGTLYATAIRAGMGPSIALFAGKERELAELYLNVGNSHQKSTNGLNKHAKTKVVMPVERTGAFWIGYDIVQLVSTFLSLLVWRAGLRESLLELETFGQRVVSQRWTEAAIAVEDPMPAFWTYHIFWPTRLIGKAWGGRSWYGVDLSGGSWVSGA